MNNPWKGKHGPLLIAEIGGNHEGNFDYAVELTKKALTTDVDFIKFQIYTADGLVNPKVSPDRYSHFKKFELKPEQHIKLAELCLAHNIGYMASVWDINAFDWIDKYITIYKIGSGDLTAYPFLKKIAGYKKPVILSTGLSTLEEILHAINYIGNCDSIYTQKDYLALLQCTSMYPIPNVDANLNVIRTLKEKTGFAVGYSDHTEGTFALTVAASMGADILEFHFTDSREGKTFRDHKVSLTPSEINELIGKIREIKLLQGNGIKSPLKSEIENGHLVSFRRGVYPSIQINPGEKFSEDNIVCLRPNHGFDPRNFSDIIGKKSKETIKDFEIIPWEINND